MKILLLEPYFSGSHQQWAEGWRQHSRHQIEILSLPGRHWKWRMLGGAVHLAQQIQQGSFQPDLIMATDMLDLSTFLGQTRQSLGTTPTALYFHENQLTYPWSPEDPDVRLARNHHYGFINYTSALSADQVFFNSQFHLDSFLTGLRSLLQRLPDYQNLENVELIRSKSSVLPLGLDLKGLKTNAPPDKKSPPLILWNHRWEYDKDPEAFFRLLLRLHKEGYDFRLAVLGARFRTSPAIFEEARETLSPKIVHFGYANNREAYAHWLHQADILPVTSRQDFFGISVIEAIYCGCFPLLPNRLAFPEHIPPPIRETFLYNGEAELYEKLKQLLNDFVPVKKLIPLQNFVARYDWSILADTYDLSMEKIV